MSYDPKDIEDVSASAFESVAMRIGASFKGFGLFTLITKRGTRLDKLRIGQKGNGLSRNITRRDIQPHEIELYGLGAQSKGITLADALKNPKRLDKWAEQRRSK